MLKNVKTVLFDMDGTLIDSMGVWKEIDKEYMEKYGLRMPENFQSKISGMSFSETAACFKETFSIPETIEEMMDTWNAMAVEKYRNQVPLKKGALAFLKYLKSTGRKTAICTSNSRYLTEVLLQSQGIENMFDCILTADEMLRGKPAPDIYLRACERLNSAPEDCLVFEDVYMGVLAGKRANMKVCAVKDVFSQADWPDMEKAADYVIEDFSFINTGFLPVSKTDLEERGIFQLDFVYVIGDAYVDHPSFGPAIISRVLESKGFTVGIIAQPDWRDKDSVSALGEPRLAFLVSGGNMDSMVNHYSVSKKRREKDAYTPGGQIGKRPDRATIVYGNLIRQTYKNTPIIIGGIEASLRRMAHYDYWSDSLKRSILLESGADIISYGMGERSIVELAEALKNGIPVSDITFVDGTVYKTKNKEVIYDAVWLPSYEELCQNKKKYAESFYIQYCNADAFSGKRLAEPYSEHCFIVQNPPAKPLSQAEMDFVYSLPYMRAYHPMYEEMGKIPAIEEVKYSLISSRGCFGGCSFCALTFHQGRIVQSRSHESILQEASRFVWEPDFKGYIHDVGGPTANFRHPSCEKQLTRGVCPVKQCLFPKPCKNLRANHSDYLSLLRKLRELPNVKKVFIRSGIRFDYLLADSDDAFFEELCAYHVSGQLKVAPEHISDKVLHYMGKPENSVYQAFVKKFSLYNERSGKKQYLVPYLMSSHPGSTLKEAIALAEYLRDLGYMPEQVQDFYPTPSTLSTCMYYTGVDPRTMEPVYTPKNPHEKAMQRALIQYRNQKNYDLVMEALKKAGRTDLIGFDKKCLIRPRKKDTPAHDGRRAMDAGKNTGIKKKKKTIRNIHKKVKK